MRADAPRDTRADTPGSVQGTRKTARWQALSMRRLPEVAGLLGLLCLGGCATAGFSMHSLPPETPAADNAQAIKSAQALKQAAPPPAPVVPLTPQDAPSMYTYDPLEPVNRFIYRFNARFDENIFLPAANTYRRIPAPARAGVHNFFGNLAELPSIANCILQLRFTAAARNIGRFAVNSSLGIGGLFDVAKHFDLPKAQTGFGSTMARWGLHPGPYLIVPILGPQTLRDGAGYLADYGISYGINIANLYRGYQSYALGTLNAVDVRSVTDFRYYATGSPFEYETIRFLYVHKELIEDAALHSKEPPAASDPNAPAGR